MTFFTGSQPQGVAPAVFDNVLTRGLPLAQQQAIASAARRQPLPNGTFLIQQGNDASCTYVLVIGHAKMTQTTVDGEEILLHYLTPGDAVGLVAVLQGRAYPVSVRAIGKCEVLVWDRRTLLALMERYACLTLNAMTVMSERMNELHERVQQLATKHVEQRLAQTLQRLARQLGTPVDGGIRIDIPVPREDLAEMIGSTTFTVSRIVSRWEHDGIIEARRDHVFIRSPHALVRIAEDLDPPRQR